MMKGYALRGAFGGFFFGIFLALTLFIYGVLNFADDLMWILPLVFLVLGLILAAWAPFGGGGSSEPATAGASPPDTADEAPGGMDDAGDTSA